MNQRAMISLHELAKEARTIFVGIIDASLRRQGTKGSCLYGAILLREMIANFGEGVVSVVIRGGDGRADGGFTDPAGRSYGHYWVEVLNSSGTYIVDITSDQFGGSPYLIVPLSDAGGAYVAGDQALVDTHVSGEIAEMQSAATAAHL